ncbi:hypothetical protein C8P63_10671 [Melghirimyces profundicolus]|uniref:Uncharacterized protein n=2 Tax=Melghirimyces profundicolus TaxID=1242148 RepID=A0A2T6C0H1_9BACL|nr:hypothetical protein C8P63_10671 [Melghirimyces profundicolus]
MPQKVWMAAGVMVLVFAIVLATGSRAEEKSSVTTASTTESPPFEESQDPVDQEGSQTFIEK